jgi:hypothetical protein
VACRLGIGLVCALVVPACARAFSIERAGESSDGPRDALPRFDQPVSPELAVVDASRDRRADTSPPADLAPVCPTGMNPVGATVCMDVDHVNTKTWVGAAAFCMGNGKRLCTETEWIAACVGGAGFLNLVEAKPEWVSDLVGDDAKLKGQGSCQATTGSGVASGLYEFRCCSSQWIGGGGMADLGAYRIDQQQGTPRSWPKAASICMGSGRRLCSASEWEGACAVAAQKALANMTNDWEWIRSVSDTTAEQRGNGSCTASSSANVLTGSCALRCCY